MSKEHPVLNMIGNPWRHTKKSKCPTNPTKRCKKLTLAALAASYICTLVIKSRNFTNCTQMRLVPRLRLRYSYPSFASGRKMAQNGARQCRSPHATNDKWQGLGKAKTLGIAWRATLCNSASVSGLKEFSRLEICASICPCQLSEVEFKVGKHTSERAYMCIFICVCVCVDMQTDMHTYRHMSHYVTSQCRLD